jgi:hypothetical protein
MRSKARIRYHDPTERSHFLCAHASFSRLSCQARQARNLRRCFLRNESERERSSSQKPNLQASTHWRLIRRDLTRRERDFGGDLQQTVRRWRVLWKQQKARSVNEEEEGEKINGRTIDRSIDRSTGNDDEEEEAEAEAEEGIRKKENTNHTKPLLPRKTRRRIFFSFFFIPSLVLYLFTFVFYFILFYFSLLLSSFLFSSIFYSLFIF